MRPALLFGIILKISAAELFSPKYEGTHYFTGIPLPRVYCSRPFHYGMFLFTLHCVNAL